MSHVAQAVRHRDHAAMQHALAMRQKAQRYPYADYYSVLLVIFIVATSTGFNPLSPRIAFDSLTDTGDGSLFRQIGYGAIFVLSLLPSLGKRARGIYSLPRPLVLMLGWFAVTIIWSPVPDIAFRRWLLTAGLAVTALVTTANLPPVRALAALRATLLFLLCSSLIAGIVAPTLAIHQPGDVEVSVIGDWRGIFYHKNIFGAVAATAAIVETYHFSRSRNTLGFALVVLAFLALFLSGSKASMLLCFMACGVFFYLVNLNESGARQGVLVVTGLTFGIILAFIASFWTGSNLIVSDDLSFTGRGLIWNFVWSIFQQHWIGGVGYGSVFQVGINSATYALTQSTWLRTLPHAHNAYLEIGASTGLVGLILTGGAVLVLPALAVLNSYRLNRPLSSFALALMLFFAWRAMFESGLGDRDRPDWIMLLITLGILLQLARDAGFNVGLTQALGQGRRVLAPRRRPKYGVQRPG